MMGRFEDNVWEQVLDRYGDELARTDALVASRATQAPPRRSTRLVAGSAGAAGAAAALTLLLTASSGTPAFAMVRHHDGSVVVKINRRSGIAAANLELAVMEIKGEVSAVSSDGRFLPLSCLENQQTGRVVDVIFPSVAVQQREIVNGTYVAPSTTGNTGGPPQLGPWHVVACSSAGTGSSGTGSSSTGSSGSGAAGNSGAG